MTSLLTTRQLQSILQVDRTTIYRMAEAGRIPAVKVGNQWRFESDAIEIWLQTHSTLGSGRSQMPELSPDLRAEQLFPLTCVQLIQDSFAEILGVMFCVSDLDGNPITRASNAHAAPDLAGALATARTRDSAITPLSWRDAAGLLWVRALIMVGGAPRARLIGGGVAAANLHFDAQRLVAYAQRIADIFAHIANERADMHSRLQRIAEITRV